MRRYFITFQRMQFKRGQDPKQAIGIGIYGMHTFKDDFEACDFIMPILPDILGIKDLLDLPDHCVYPGTPTWDKLSRYTVDCIRVTEGYYRDPTYEVPDGSLMGLLRNRMEDSIILKKIIKESEKKGYAVIQEKRKSEKFNGSR